jgi:hypothetical protein
MGGEKAVAPHICILPRKGDGDVCKGEAKGRGVTGIELPALLQAGWK